MPKTVLQLSNYALSLIGESPLINTTTSSLGTLVKDALQTAINTVVQDTRASVFETTTVTAVTNPDYLVPAVTFSSQLIQLYTVFLLVDNADGDIPFGLKDYPLETIRRYPGYCVEGNSLYLSPTIARPCDIRTRQLVVPLLPALDATDSGLPELCIPAVAHTAAGILALSYLDDPGQAAAQQNLADIMKDKLRSQFGATRASSFRFTI